MSPPPHDLERLRTTMVDFIVMGTQGRVVDFVRVGYFIPLNGPLNGHPPSDCVREAYAFGSASFLEDEH